MALHVPHSHESTRDAQLSSEFVDRLSDSLHDADRARRRRTWLLRLRRALPLILLIGPILGWRLMLTSPDGLHVAIAGLVSLAFLLDVAVHVNTTTLSFLGMTWLPSIVGGLLFVLVAVTLLTRRDP